jgi:hypothetical protein
MDCLHDGLLRITEDDASLHRYSGKPLELTQFNRTRREAVEIAAGATISSVPATSVSPEMAMMQPLAVIAVYAAAGTQTPDQARSEKPVVQSLIGRQDFGCVGRLLRFAACLQPNDQSKLWKMHHETQEVGPRLARIVWSGNRIAR